MAENILGKRIKYFRGEAGMSQLELETEVGLAYGSISRIEAGKVNPSKETLEKIINALHLWGRRVDYLEGRLVYPPREEDISFAQDKVKDYFAKKGVLAYLVDDRYRIWGTSTTFIKMLNLNPEQTKKIIGAPFAEIILDPDYGVRKYLEGGKFEGTLFVFFTRFNNEAAFMVDDPDVQKNLRAIHKDPIARRLWEKLDKKPNPEFHKLLDKEVTFKVGNFSISMSYSVEPIFENPRFEVIEYTPNNKLIRFLAKL